MIPAAGWIAIAVALCVIAWRVDAWVADRRADRQAIETQRLADAREHARREAEIRERTLAVEEREVALEERASPLDVPPPSEFPGEMFAGAMAESEEWAAEDAIQLIGEAYLEGGGDWQRARAYLMARYATNKGSRLSPEQLAEAPSM